jgi:hypothetical protein
MIADNFAVMDVYTPDQKPGKDAPLASVTSDPYRPKAGELFEKEIPLTAVLPLHAIPADRTYRVQVKLRSGKPIRVSEKDKDGKLKPAVEREQVFSMRTLNIAVD